jgi:Na+/H+ antiporter NhaC
MAIIYPLALPACHAICQEAGLSPEQSMQIFYHTISVVLAGAVMGDHCSPLADTTILSSLASGCNHIEHVRTQLPYSVSVGGISLFLCVVPVNFQIPWYLNYLLGALLIVLLISLLGKKQVQTEP